jgi:hypothetical protein
MRLDPVDLTLQAQAQQRTVDAAQARARKAIATRRAIAVLWLRALCLPPSTTRLKRRPIPPEADLSAARRRQAWRKTRRAMPYCWPIQTAW